MELKPGYKSLEEQEFFEWITAEDDRIDADTSILETERKARQSEIGDIFILSTLERKRPGVAEHVGARYAERIRQGKNYYDIKPFHYSASSTVK